MQTENKTEQVVIQIRKLKVADRKRLSAMIEKLTERVGDDALLNTISSAVTQRNAAKSNEETQNGDNLENSVIQIGIKIIKMCLQVLEDETHEWFADLLNVTKEEFIDLPLDTEVIVIEQMVQAEEASSFFTIASRLYKKIETLQSRFAGAKNESDTATD